VRSQLTELERLASPPILNEVEPQKQK
jgi:hypothetical protein